MSTLGVGVVGCGVISDIYLKNAALFPQFEIRAVADLRAEAAEEKARAYGVEALTVEALLAREDIGIVLNLTIPAAHAEIGHRALAAGKHVYSEKPLAGSFDEARALNDAAQAAGLDPTRTSFDAMVWMLVLWLGLHLGLNWVMQLYVTARIYAGHCTPRYCADHYNLTLYGHFVVITGLTTFGLLALFPMLMGVFG